MKPVLKLSKKITKAISWLIVGIFLCAQVASAAHNHSHTEAHEHSHQYDHGDEDDTPEPNLCMTCIASTYDDEFALDQNLSPTRPIPFEILNTLAGYQNEASGVSFSLKRESLKVPEPPDLGSFPPRAPPL